MNLVLDKYLAEVEAANVIRLEGRVKKVVGTIIEGQGPAMPIGGVCRILSPDGTQTVMAEVVGFKEGVLLLMSLDKAEGIQPGSTIIAERYHPTVSVGDEMLGRIIDGLGNPLDQGPPVKGRKSMPLYAPPYNPLKRLRIKEALDVGVRTINCLVTLAKGQRTAIMAGSGVGKSVLLGMMARYTKADVNVIALIGERGREVREFIERDLGPEGLQHSVVVVATSDSAPLIRVRGAYLAATIAEYFREQGRDVLLLMDSITRFAMATREVGLAAGEPPTNKAYPPSTFAHLPKLLERAGTHQQKGSITGIYTVLVEGDDFNEPIADAVRSIVDGHIVLDRHIAAQGAYPAIDVLNSVSRLMTEIIPPECLERAYQFRTLLADYARIEDLVHLGAYEKGNNPRTDLALEMIESLKHFMRQTIGEASSMEEGFKKLEGLLANKKMKH